jgi:hypothetical protein
MVRGHYQLPLRPGYSIEMNPESLAAYNFDGGAAWKELA